MQQQEDFVTRYQKSLNNAFGVSVVFQQCFIIPLRKNFGVETLGMRCFLALILMILWSAFSNDIFMWWYTGIWFMFFIHRRVQSLRLQRQIHSCYDGLPVDAMRICKNESIAKQWIEPIMVGLAGVFAKWFYDQHGWPLYGLPYFLITGAVVMAFVQMGHQAVWKRRIRGIQDALIENEQMIRDFRNWR
jgi:hypothetical protein